MSFFSGVSNCAWGKNEWCANAVNAKRCNKLQYCLKKHWFRDHYHPNSLTRMSSSTSFSLGANQKQRRMI